MSGCDSVLIMDGILKINVTKRTREANTNEELPSSEDEVRKITGYKNWASHAKTCLLAYAGSEGPDQPAHPRSLIRAFAVRKQNHWIQQNV